MATQTTKRYKTATEDLAKERQLSSLFTIITSNLLLATEVLSTDFKIKAAGELEFLSRKARSLAKDLVSNSKELTKQELTEKVSSLKNRMLNLVTNLTEEIGKLDSNKKINQKTMEDLILARRLLRESQRGLITIQD